MNQGDYNAIRDAENAGETDTANLSCQYFGAGREAYLRGRAKKRQLSIGAPTPPVARGIGPRMNNRQIIEAEDDRLDAQRYDDWTAEKNF